MHKQNISESSPPSLHPANLNMVFPSFPLGRQGYGTVLVGRPVYATWLLNRFLVCARLSEQGSLRPVSVTNEWGFLGAAEAEGRERGGRTAASSPPIYQTSLTTLVFTHILYLAFLSLRRTPVAGAAPCAARTPWSSARTSAASAPLDTLPARRR